MTTLNDLSSYRWLGSTRTPISEKKRKEAIAKSQNLMSNIIVINYCWLRSLNIVI